MKKLSFLLKSVAHYEVYGDAEIEISSLDFDSRKIVASDQGCSMYVAQKGTQFDGHLFINQVIEKGARAIVCEEMPQEICSEVTYVKVENSAVALGFLASAFYDDPSTKIKLVGITGTNGKTTTVTLLHRLFMNLGYATGLLSTIQNKIEERIIPSTHTTPDALELNRLLHEMVLQGCEYCFMEVSSHAICQHRIAGVQFAGAVFSNITHDHLDFHKTFAHYITAKKAFFDHLAKESFALTNIDDKNGKVMVQNSEARIFTYSLLTAADFKGVVLDNGFEGLQMTMNGKEVFFKLSGKFNAYNLLAIYGTALLLGMEEEEVLQKMSDLDSAAGRFQMIKNQRGCTAIVDYAHTPDALKNVLSTIQDITQHSVEIITVIGCGGDRDALKRPIMAATACQYSHKVILTSDNPRTEDPNKILEEMQTGVPAEKRRNVLVIENRREAIKTACMMISDHGVLLVAGKGHENYQEINHVKHHFDDAEEIAAFLQ